MARPGWSSTSHGFKRNHPTTAEGHPGRCFAQRRVLVTPEPPPVPCTHYPSQSKPGSGGSPSPLPKAVTM